MRSFICWLTFQISPNSPYCRPKPGHWTPLWFFFKDGRDPGTQVNIWCLLKCTPAGSWKWTQNWDLDSSILARDVVIPKSIPMLHQTPAPVIQTLNKNLNLTNPTRWSFILKTKHLPFAKSLLSKMYMLIVRTSLWLNEAIGKQMISTHYHWSFVSLGRFAWQKDREQRRD